MPLNASVPTFIVPVLAKKYQVVKDEQSLNALAPMLVTALGIIMLVSELHPLRELAPMLATDDGMVIFARREQFRKEDGPMVVTVFAIV